MSAVSHWPLAVSGWLSGNRKRPYRKMRSFLCAFDFTPAALIPHGKAPPGPRLWVRINGARFHSSIRPICAWHDR